MLFVYKLLSVVYFVQFMKKINLKVMEQNTQILKEIPGHCKMKMNSQSNNRRLPL